MTILTCNIPQPTLKYNIQVVSGLLKDHEALAKSLRPLGNRFVIISDEQVFPIHGKQLELSLRKWLDISSLCFPAGEQYKTRQTKQLLEDRMLRQSLGRDTCIIALGGGVVTDVAGYVAATYCRGIPFVAIPTTLLAMVDASVGGKTGIDVSQGKNLLGCIHQPANVLIDTDTLDTLPDREFRNGIAEMIKHGIIADANHFQYLETHKNSMRDPVILKTSIIDSLTIKKDIVERDPTETGLRRLLNFGHTIGHALEKLSGYSIAHGEAVAIGMVIEAQISFQKGYLAIACVERIANLISAFGLPTTVPEGYSATNLMQTMTSDKNRGMDNLEASSLKVLDSP